VAQLYPRALGSLSVASYDSRGLRWRYSNPPPHGVTTLWSLEFFLRPTVSRPVSLGIGPPFGTLVQILFCSSFFIWQLRYSSFKAPSLRRKRVCSLQCNHSLVRSVTPNNHILQSHLRLLPFCRLLRLAGTTVEVFWPASTWESITCTIIYTFLYLLRWLLWSFLGLF
jgi:hypothetical protein